MLNKIYEPENKQKGSNMYGNSKQMHGNAQYVHKICKYLILHTPRNRIIDPNQYTPFYERKFYINNLNKYINLHINTLISTTS